MNALYDSISHGLSPVSVWVVGFGNEYREDDGAGVILASRIYEFLREDRGVDANLCLEHQLLPELVSEMTAADLVIFCDADTAVYEDGFCIREIFPDSRLDGFNIHSMGPEWLLALAKRTGADKPKKALLATVSGERFDFSENVTPVCLARIDKALNSFRFLWYDENNDKNNR
ncbi:hydrogenase [Synergistales bacterium]|nr:hydrogenase [Synergistales bacterium]